MLFSTGPSLQGRKDADVGIDAVQPVGCLTDYGRPSPLCDPLIRLGRQFGRTVHAFFPLKTLLANGIVISADLAAFPEETLTPG